MPPGICKDCAKLGALDETTKVVTNYCWHSSTGALLIPMMGKPRWMMIHPISMPAFAKYIADLMFRGMKQSKKKNPIIYN